MFVKERTVAISVDLRRRVDAMQSVFARADEDTKEFAQRSGLSCPPGCGACCNNPSVEATVGELLPLALEIVTLGLEEEFHARASANLGTRCILFKQVGVDSNRGMCTNYVYRPLVCRLFGYAGVNSHGKVVLAACKIHKITQAEAVKSASSPPLMSNYAMEALAVFEGSRLSVERLPINEALMRAIEYVALRARICEEALQGAAKIDSLTPPPVIEAG